MKTKLLLLTFLACIELQVARAQCSAGFSFNNAGGSSTVYFYDSSTVANGTIVSYVWSYGDSTSDSGAFVSHTYSSGGWYTVSLTIITSLGCMSSTSGMVWVNPIPCQLVTTISYAAFVQDLDVQVFGGSAPYTYQWSNGSTAQALHLVPPGVYCVTVTDAQGCTGSACYTVPSSSQCQASFTAQAIQGTTSVDFVDNSFAPNGDSIVSYYYDFGDGTSSALSNTIHTYSLNGVYNVSLNILTNTGCSSTFYDSIFVGIPNCNLTGSVSYNAQNHQLNATPFTGTGPYAYQWTPAFGLNSYIISSPTVSVSSQTTYCVVITDVNGCSFTSCITVAPTYADTICGNVFIDSNGNGVQDSTENAGYGYLTIYGTGGQFSAAIDSMTGHYSLTVPAGTYEIYLCPFGSFVTYTVPGNDTAGCGLYHNVVVSGGGAHCGYNFGMQFNQAFVEGNVFIDANNNGLKDANEAGVPYQAVHVGSYWGYSDLNGHYKITVVPGTYVVSYSPSGIYTGYSLTTASSYSVTVANGASSMNNNFGVYITPGSTNLSVSIHPYTTVSPGFPAWYTITVQNMGANATAGTLTMVYDQALQFTNASPSQASVNSGARIITWNLPVITPGASKNYSVHFVASTGITIGATTAEFVNVTASIGTDINLSNNFDSIHQIITGSWDPNNKLVVASNYSEPAYQVISSINPDQTIHYTINFQNTGNAPAINISVLDELSADLDPASFELLGTSHNAEVTRNGSQLNFLFPNILLEDSTHNEPASHGFINFKIKAKPGLATGHVISDVADIYFDFNAPVATNDAALLMINPLSILSLKNNSNDFVVTNPVRDLLRLQFHLEKTSKVTIRVKTLDGKLMQQIDLADLPTGLNSYNVNTAAYPEGVYFIEMNDGKVLRTSKFVRTN